MNITRGIKARAQRVVIYGAEGIGKSSLASQFPEPLFIDTEGSTDNMDVARLDKPTSWTMLRNQIAWVKANPTVCKTLVIDTIDWAETLIVQDICSQHGKKGIEDFGYGNGYTYAREEMGRFLNLLQDLIEIGINVVLTAHAQMRKFEQPDEMGAYDRWELKLGKKTSSQTAPIVKEWADMVLFCNYKTVVVSSDGNKKKAQGGKRVIYTEHHPAWDAKNRHGLPAELDMDFKHIAHIFTQPVEKAPVNQQTVAPNQAPLAVDDLTTPFPDERDLQDDVTIKHHASLPKALTDLMDQAGVTDTEMQQVPVVWKHFPASTPLENIPPAYWDMIIANFEQTLNTIKTQIRQ
ncbi:ATP-binding protein [Carnobacteriaceae bacterium zg-ZUI252]|nr:ATP-binding protein [Carnobacteriaceae bacterium zg-ZUI252]